MEKIPNLELSNDFIKEQVFKRNFNQDLQVSMENLDECLQNQASLYAYYSVNLQKITAEKNQAEFDYDNIINKAMIVVRQELLGENAKVTEKQIEARVKSMPEVIASKQKVIELLGKRDLLYSLTRALEHKKDSVLALAYRRKNEIDALVNKSAYSKIPVSGIED